jgi:hypothetical protein
MTSQNIPGKGMPRRRGRGGGPQRDDRRTREGSRGLIAPASRTAAGGRPHSCTQTRTGRSARVDVSGAPALSGTGSPYAGGHLVCESLPGWNQSCRSASAATTAAVGGQHAEDRAAALQRWDGLDDVAVPAGHQGRLSELRQLDRQGRPVVSGARVWAGQCVKGARVWAGQCVKGARVWASQRVPSQVGYFG